jgi:hypothetical protein
MSSLQCESRDDRVSPFLNPIAPLIVVGAGGTMSQFRSRDSAPKKKVNYGLESEEHMRKRMERALFRWFDSHYDWRGP